MFNFVPWKLICIFLLFQLYGPELTSVKFHHFIWDLFSHDYCKDDTNKVQCYVDKLNGLVILANETYNSWFRGIFEGFKEQMASKKEKELLYSEPTGAVKGNVGIAMSDLIEKMKKEYESTLPGDAANLVKQRLETIAFDYQKTSAFCSVDFGLDPSIIAKRIGNIAEMTKMPRNLQIVLEQTVTVLDAGTNTAENTVIAVDGIVHIILIAASRNAKNSFDIGMAVFSIDYKIGPKENQDGDEEMIKKFIRFSNTNKVESKGSITFEGVQDLKAYFSGEAYKMLVHKCPSLLTGFRKVQQDIKSEN